NRIALVTGASSGLGAQFASCLARQGAKVAIAARRLDRLEQLANEIKHAGGDCFPVQCDVTHDEEVERLIKAVSQHYGGLDILVNNAGAAKSAPSTDVSMEDYDYVMDINSRAVFLVAREAAKGMLARSYGRIINIASMYGLVGNKFSASASYHASKGAVVNMTRALAAEWGKHGVTVNAICPGFFASELTSRLMEQEAFISFVQRSTCLERFGQPGELDTALLFLAADTSGYVTGQTIVVDGGWTCI
ncbi:hypothetical protein AAG570_014009, partial [Ranatra chinensis]